MLSANYAWFTSRVDVPVDIPSPRSITHTLMVHDDNNVRTLVVFTLVERVLTLLLSWISIYVPIKDGQFI